MFNNNINKPAITVFLPLTSAKTSFFQWQKLVFAGKNYFCRDGFFRGKKRFLPVTGKNLPTLTGLVKFIVLKQMLVAGQLAIFLSSSYE